MGPERQETEAIFSAFSQINVCDIIGYVQGKTGFLETFDHIQPRYAKSSLEDKSAFACLVAAGTNLGLQKMSEISDIPIATLTSTYRNFFRLENLRNASRQVINAASALEAYNHFNVRSNQAVHAGADGQKFGVRKKNAKARHSPKYFHMDSGVVAYSLVANHVPINAKVIGANEHESHHLFDLVFNNNTDIDPEVISTDMHGVNRTNFAFLYMFGRDFAPRYTQIHRRFGNLSGFAEPSY